jgi:SecD/SecF fusion protein
MAYLFTKPSEKEITINSTNDQVIAKIRKESKDAIKRTYNVLLTRIDKFGVVNPNMNLDENKGIITVELAGIRNPERVRSFLQATAKLQFFEAYSNDEIINALQPANDALAAYLSGAKEEVKADTNAATVKANANDTASLATILGDKKSTTKDSAATKQADLAKKNPLLSVWMPNITQQGAINEGPVVGYVAKRDTAKLNEFRCC